MNLIHIVPATTPPVWIDFHSHHLGPGFEPAAPDRLPPAQRAFWEKVNRQLVSRTALLDAIDEAGLTARVISTPLEFIRSATGAVTMDMVRRINDETSALVREHPGRLYGLATVDAFGGEDSAREVERAVSELGLHGVFVESAREELLPDAAQARPTFGMAARLGVPVFLHPVPDPGLRQRFARCGAHTERLARSTNNSAALLALLECGVFEEHPGLHVVVTALALNGLLIAACLGDGARLHKDEPSATRRHVYVDTTGQSPLMIRTAVDIVGADHVLMGSDWPVVDTRGLSSQVQAVLAAAGLNAVDQGRVAGGNALQLLQRQGAARVAQGERR
jgi:aminocarboxymuconate-semialdehyde decarboxylase